MLLSPARIGTPRASPAVSTPRNVLVDAPCNVSSNAEVQQALDPVTRFLYEEWIGCGGIGFSRSIDGGFSFQPALVVPGSLGYSWDPALAVSSNGTVYAAYMTNDGTGDQPRVAWSWNHGGSFAGNASAFVPTLTEFSDRDFIAVAPNGTLYLTWDYGPNGSLDANGTGCASAGSCYFVSGDYNAMFVRSTDGGKNWSNPVPIDAAQYPWGGSPAAPLLVEPNGAIDVLFEDYNTTAQHNLTLGYNYFTQSTDGGASWSPRVRVSVLPFANTSWWIDGTLSRDNSGTLYAAFDSSNQSVDTAWATVSRDDGATWASPTRLNPDADSAIHIMATVAGGENGTSYVTWMSNNSTLGWSLFEEVFSGNGSSLSPPTVVSAMVGINGVWGGDTTGLTYLGQGEVALSWGYGVLVNGTPASEVYAAVLGEGLPDPTLPPLLTAGTAQVTVNWARPAAGAPVTGYVVSWGPSKGPLSNFTTGVAPTSALVSGLSPFLLYSFSVAAFNGAGIGPASSNTSILLTAWGVVSGHILPASALASFDGKPLTSVGGSFTVNSTTGPHTLTVTKPDYAPQEFAVTLPWNGSTYQNASLHLLGGELMGFVTPSFARVTLDGISISTTPKGFFQASETGNSSHDLRASAYGFDSQSSNLTVPANGTVWRNFTLSAQNGTIALSIVPVAATVLVGGQTVPLSTSGQGNASRAPGTYEVEAKAPGFVTEFQNVSIGPLALHYVNLTLAPLPSLPVPPGSSSSSNTLLLYASVGALLIALVVVAVYLIGRARPPTQPEFPIGGEDDMYPRPEEAGEPVEEPPEPEAPGEDEGAPREVT
ncbi:MAG: fibronectin type III domain-containing protein [Thermoplasmata archaeon]|nr:fibronectin type III domain-containing protein [Thermoplasmata archaeon]